MPTLFDPLRIWKHSNSTPHCIMAPSMTRSRADDEGVQPEYAATYYAQRASAGSIITEATKTSHRWRKVISVRPESTPTRRLRAGDQ